jgi:hypothetical protein
MRKRGACLQCAMNVAIASKPSLRRAPVVRLSRSCHLRNLSRRRPHHPRMYVL